MQPVFMFQRGSSADRCSSSRPLLHSSFRIIDVANSYTTRYLVISLMSFQLFDSWRSVDVQPLMSLMSWCVDDAARYAA